MDQSSPLGTYATDAGTGESRTANVTGVANGAIVDAVGVNNSPAITSTQTGRVDQDNGDSNERLGMATSSSVGSVAMSWSWTGSQYSTLVAVPVLPAARRAIAPIIFQ